LLGHGVNSTPETITTKLHWALSQNLNIADVMTKNLCGEHRERLME